MSAGLLNNCHVSPQLLTFSWTALEQLWGSPWMVELYKQPIHLNCYVSWGSHTSKFQVMTVGLRFKLLWKFSFSSKLEFYFVPLQYNPWTRWVDHWEKCCICLSCSYSSLRAEEVARGWLDPAPNHCSSSYLTSACQWDLPLLAHKKSLIKYYCGATLCVTAQHRAARHRQTSLVREAALPVASC